ncbi:MAG: peptidoglycan-binding protein [Leptolyngbyaceae cyanobacterium SU_3_3]|nr:peptidoglycan-binding protein [Leptolyngbyaceae cyanobacterium SU_3_3]
METLGYLHLACINELSENPTSVHSTARIRWKFPVEIWVKFLSIATSLAILSLANAAMALLQEGDRGLEVGSLQRQLASQGCYSGEIDDVFGPQTRVAVVACQRKFGLDPDGMAGERTLAALAGNPVDQNFFSQPFATTNLSDTTGAVLRQGSEGSAVSDLQERLTAAGFSTGTIDGIFGAQTDAAVRSFQRSRDLIPDGVVGDQVYQALDARTPIEPSATRPLSTPSNSRQLAFNTTGADVKELQRRLTSAGYRCAPNGLLRRPHQRCSAALSGKSTVAPDRSRRCPNSESTGREYGG